MTSKKKTQGRLTDQAAESGSFLSIYSYRYEFIFSK